MEWTGRRLIITIIISMLIGAGGMYGGLEWADLAGDEPAQFDGKGELIDRQMGMPEANKVIEIMELTGMSNSSL